jgi:hydroxymethylpyrimidine/phosphomethylpyrimidine kinase
MDRVRTALTIAGSDSGGGAGIQADLKTFSALGVFGTSAITAITAQNTLGVTAVFEVPPEIVAAQIDAVLTDIGADAVKTGMLSNSEIIRVVAAKVREYGISTLVVDPVMVATSGDMLLEPDAVDALRFELLPLADVITPNLAEAARVLGTAAATNVAEMETQARALLALGPKAVLLKGGHGDGAEAIDVLVRRNAAPVHLALPRIATPNTHGTGCTMSAAIAAHLARGESLADAVQGAKHFVHAALVAGAALKIGGGSGPVDHLFSIRDGRKS